MELCPLKFTHGGRLYQRAKLFADSDGTRIYHWPNGRRSPELVVEDPGQPVALAEKTRGGDDQWRVGDLTVVKLCGCVGCGRLGRWRPDGGPARVKAKGRG